MKCAVITPIGPGHKEIYSRCVQSINEAIQNSKGPFSAIEIISMWDLQGKFGRSARRNAGMLQARKTGCDWLFFLDADDYLSPDAFHNVSEYIESHDAIWGNICEAPSNDLDAVKLREGQLTTITSIEDILNTDPFFTLQMGHFVKTSCALDVKFDEKMNTGEDFKYYLQLWSKYKCIKAPVIFFVNCRGQHSQGQKSADGRAWRVAVTKEINAFKANLSTVQKNPIDNPPEHSREKILATHIFRIDNTNVGDWWSPPMRYFPFRPGPAYDLLDAEKILNNEKIVIVGGGGLGTQFFASHLDRIKNKSRSYKLIAWGVGVDNIVNTNGKPLDPNQSYDLYGTWFDDFDEVGTRVWGNHPRFKWVPCSSCLHPAFFKYREIKPSRLLGIYNHKRVPLTLSGSTDIAVLDNSGDNLIEKLEFIANHEYILTNTYHGVYWATLLNRKVICLPFKSGLFSFKHAPVYSDGNLSDATLQLAKSYPESLEECRTANIEYYCYLANKYGDF